MCRFSFTLSLRKSFCEQMFFCVQRTKKLLPTLSCALRFLLEDACRRMETLLFFPTQPMNRQAFEMIRQHLGADVQIADRGGNEDGELHGKKVATKNFLADDLLVEQEQRLREVMELST